jgi:hypothetical protein
VRIAACNRAKITEQACEEVCDQMLRQDSLQTLVKSPRILRLLRETLDAESKQITCRTRPARHFVCF